MSGLNPLLVSLLSNGSASLVEAVALGTSSSSPSSSPSPPLSALLKCASDCLGLFCQLNWVGPPDREGVESELSSALGKDVLEKFNKDSLEAFSTRGSPPYGLCVMPLLLHLPRLLLGEAPGRGDEVSVKHLLIRCLFMEQQVLEERSSSLWDTIRELVVSLEAMVTTSHLSESEQSELYLELGHVCLYYLQYDSAEGYFEKASQLAHVTSKMTGALGKRTRFQQSEIAQLMLEVSTGDSHTPDGGATSREVDSHTPEGGATSLLPREVSLDDDTLLNEVEYTRSRDTLHLATLSPLQQATLLGWCTYYKKTKAVDHFTDEEMEAYLTQVLWNPQCWVIQSHALFLKALLGRNRSRLQQRNMQQLEELVASFTRPHPKPEDRMPFYHCVPVQPLWVIQKELVGVLVGLGCLNAALEVLTQLELWEELAKCYQAVGRKAKAKEIVEERIDIEATPSLWCLLGDLTQNADCYLRAWELSNRRSSRAQRSLGLFYLRRGQYKESIPHMQSSLSINSLQDGLWFSLGCAASEVGDVALSIKAWHHAVSMEPDFLEAWNNLAGAYLKRKEKRKAHKIYEEALRCNYSNPKIWENYLLVSTDLQEWRASLRAYHRLVELKHKYVDVEILSVLVEAIVKGFPEKSVQPAVEHRKSLGELLGRLVGCGQVEADVWRMYAHFHFSSTDTIDLVKGVHELKKAQRTSRLAHGWERTLEGVARVSQFTLEYCKTTRELCAGDLAGNKEVQASLSSAKLALQSVLTAAKKFGVVSCERMEAIVQQLETEMGLVLQTINN